MAAAQKSANAINRGVVAGANGRMAIKGVIAIRPTVSAFGRFIDDR
jgi:hypothetical protein